MNEINVRLIQPTDLSAVHQMVCSLAAHHGDAATLSVETLARDVFSDMPWLRVLVAQHEGALVGYAALCPMVQLQFGVRGMDIHHLFVEQALRGRGIGKALIDASLAEVRFLGGRFMTVGTHPENSRAAALYVAAGFEPLPPPGPRFRIKVA